MSADAPAAALMPVGGQVIVGGVIALCCLSSLNALILAGARISHALGGDFHHFSKLGVWNEKRNSPVNALIVQGVFSTLFVVVAGSFEKVLVYTTAVVWFYYLLVGLSVFIFRWKDKKADRPYRVWLYPFIPFIFCASCIFLVISGIKYDLKGTLMTFSIVIMGAIYFSIFKCGKNRN